MEEKKEEIAEVTQEATVNETVAVNELGGESDVDEASSDDDKEKESEAVKKIDALFDKLAAVCDEEKAEPTTVLNVAMRLVHAALGKEENPYIARDVMYQILLAELANMKEENIRELYVRRLIKAKADEEAKKCACGECDCKNHETPEDSTSEE